MNIEQAKDAAAREIRFDSIRLCEVSYPTFEDARRSAYGEVLNQIVNRAIELCIEGERQRIMEALPTSEDAAFEMLIKYGGNTKMGPKLKTGFADGFNFLRDKIYDLINN